MKVTTTFVVIWSAIVLAGCDRSRDGSKAESTRNDETHRNRSTAEPLLTDGPELRKRLADFLTVERRTSGWSLSQTIPESKVKKQYVVQFDVQSDGYPGPEWRLLFVIVWKAENLGSQWLDPIRRSTIWMNGHVLRPASGKPGIYALQPDYSLRQIPLTAEETARLFSRLTDWEKRNDERAASVIHAIEQDAPDWREQLSAELDEERRFPRDEYWDQKVDTHLKVVEPEKGVLDQRGEKGISPISETKNGQ